MVGRGAGRALHLGGECVGPGIDGAPFSPANPGSICWYTSARNFRLPVIGWPCQSSRPVGATSQVRVRAWIQYSRLRPPGCGSGVPKVRSSWGTAPGGRLTCAASASAFCAARGSSSRTCSPPIVHRNAAPADNPKKERRVVLRSGIVRLVGADIPSAGAAV